jgi:hypothetical protein
MKTTLFQDIEIEYSRQLVPLLLRNSLMLTLCCRHDRRLLTLAPNVETLDVELCTFPGPSLVTCFGRQAAVAVDSQVQLFRLDATPWCDRPRERAWWWLFPDRSRFLGPLRAADLHLTAQELWLQSETDGSLLQMPLLDVMRPAWHPGDCPQTAGGEWQGAGLALDGQAPAYIALTALRSKTPHSQLIDLSSNQPLPVTLRQFHTPRLHQNELWVLDSEQPALVSFNRSTGAITARHAIEGQPTTVAFHATCAIVAGSLNSEATAPTPMVSVIDLRTGAALAQLHFRGGLTGIDGLALIPNLADPAATTSPEKTAST